jgi:hypothetical protein
MNALRKIGLMTCVFCLSGTAFAASPAITIKSEGRGGVDENCTLGWQFAVNRDVTVTMLGIWNGPPPTYANGRPVGASMAHKIAIWDQENKLVTSVTMLRGRGWGEKLIDEFLYVPIEPVLLHSGQRYEIGASYQRGGEVFQVNGIAKNSIFKSDPAVTWLRSCRRNGGNDLQSPDLQSIKKQIDSTIAASPPEKQIGAPSSSTDGVGGYFGPNLMFDYVGP